MATITLDLTKKLTKTENDEALEILADALIGDSEAVEDKLTRSKIKHLLKRGALRLDR